MPVAHLAVVDLQGPLDLAVSAVGRAAQENGCFLIRNHGVRHTMQSMSSLFGLPESDKLQNCRSNVLPVGYSPFESENVGKMFRDAAKPDPVEKFTVLSPVSSARDPRLPENAWFGIDADLRYCLQCQFEDSQRVAYQVLELFALALDFPRAHFRTHFTPGQNPSALRAFAYRAGDRGTRSLLMAEHTDTSALSLCLQDACGGFEYFDFSLQTFIAVPPVPDVLLCNVGDLLEHWTGGKFKSCRHRVRVDLAPSEFRYSQVFFCNPNLDTCVACFQPSDAYPDFVYWDMLKARFARRKVVQPPITENKQVAPVRTSAL